MKPFYFLALLPLVLLTAPAYGLADLNEVDVIGESNDFNSYFLVLEFGEYEYTRNGKIIPILNSGFLDINGEVTELKNVKAKIYGNSFVLKSDNYIMYAKGLGDDQYRINLYEKNNHVFQNKVVLGTSDQISDERVSIIKNEPIPPNLDMLIQQDFRTFWKQPYDITVRVYDLDVNPKPEFHSSHGAVEGADVSVKLTHEDGNELVTISGKTDDKGVWEGQHFMVENLTLAGKYFVDIITSFEGAEKTQKLETFVIGSVQKPTSSNSTGP